MMRTTSSSDGPPPVIAIGDYIVLQKQKYFKLHQLNAKCDVMLGKDKVDLRAIVGQPFWTTFKMVPKERREFGLEVTTQVDSFPEAVMRDVSSGLDNRNITDDGKSQLLSTEDIVAFRDSGFSAQTIVGKLITSSTTFQSKTEYSQEKYLKKKEKKYFEYIVIRKPTVRLIAQILYSKDQVNVLGLRHDSISQILCYANVQSNGTYLLCESGTQAIVGAAVLDCLSERGRLLNVSLGKTAQKQAILGMNFSKSKSDCCLNVRFADLVEALEGRKESEVVASPVEEHNSEAEQLSTTKRKHEEDNGDVVAAKRPRWLDALETATEALRTDGADGLIVACKELPLVIVKKLIQFVNPSRQLVVYSVHREPLVQLYEELKRTRRDVVNLHIYENWLRNYQILPDRTHPDVTMSSNGGHLLVGTKVNVL